MRGELVPDSGMMHRNNISFIGSASNSGCRKKNSTKISLQLGELRNYNGTHIRRDDGIIENL
jgi:hypothetical protein